MQAEQLKSLTDKLTQLQAKIHQKQKELQFLNQLSSGQQELHGDFHYVRFVYRTGNGNSFQEIGSTKEDVEVFAVIMASRISKELKDLQDQVSGAAEAITYL